MTAYVEVEGVRALARHNRVLAKRLKAALAHKERREIGYPQGKFTADVRFVADTGDDVFWWAGRASDDGEVALNFFGHGAPGEKAVLNIDVQFNLPVREFTRRRGGAFVEDKATGDVLLAHHGIVTLGHGRVTKDALFAEMAATLREVEISNGTADVLLIGELESPTLIDDIASFGAELRRTVKQIKAGIASTPSTTGVKGKGGTNVPTSPLGKLKTYFDEFSGKKNIKGKRAAVADCYHGTVVRALRDQFGGSDRALKTREIDLVALTSKKAFVFEVKTSANTQSIYTAIGQLLVHSPVVARYAPQLTLEKVIVVPEKPTDRLFSVLTEQLGIHVLTFVRAGSGHVTIAGLPKLL